MKMVEPREEYHDPSMFDYDRYQEYIAEQQLKRHRLHMKIAAVITSIVFALVQLLTLYLVAVETLPLWQAIIILALLNAAIYLELNRSFINEN